MLAMAPFPPVAARAEIIIVAATKDTRLTPPFCLLYRGGSSLAEQAKEKILQPLPKT